MLLFKCDGIVVVVEGDNQRAGVLVDELLGQQQIVIKSLETNFKRVCGLSGATILGDGSVALILDFPGLIKLSNTLPVMDEPDEVTSTETSEEKNLASDELAVAT